MDCHDLHRGLLQQDFHGHGPPVGHTGAACMLDWDTVVAGTGHIGILLSLPVLEATGSVRIFTLTAIVRSVIEHLLMELTPL